jgi:hypothetical protein
VAGQGTGNAFALECGVARVSIRISFSPFQRRLDIGSINFIGQLGLIELQLSHRFLLADAFAIAADYGQIDSSKEPLYAVAKEPLHACRLDHRLSARPSAATGQSTLSQQVYKLLREAIARQQLLADTALPASRMLAQALQIGRNTVLAAYDQLLAEGYLYSRQGQGLLSARPSAVLVNPATASGHAGLSQRGQALSDQYRLAHRPDRCLCSRLAGVAPVPTCHLAATAASA